MKLFGLALTLVVCLNAENYRKPPREVLDVLNAPGFPVPLLSPARTHLLLQEMVRNPSIRDLSRPMLRLAGVRIDPASNGPHLVSYASGLIVKPIAGGSEKRVEVPAGAKIFGAEFSYDGRKIAFLNQTDSSTELWLVDVATGKARKADGVRVNASLVDAVVWMPDNSGVLVPLVPAGRGAAPSTPVVPPGPKIQESDGKAGPTRTYQDMLSSPHDEALFEYYATSQLALYDTGSGKSTNIGPPAIYWNVKVAPSGKYVLTSQSHRLFSYLLPVQLFPRDVEVMDLRGTKVQTVANLPAANNIPIEGVPTGPRAGFWKPTEPHTVMWIEALDGGDSRAKAEFRDRLMQLPVPSKAAPLEFTRLEQRVGGPVLFLQDGRAIVSDYERGTRLLRTFLISEGGKKQLFARNIQDRYRDPGTPLVRILPNGARLAEQQGDHVFLKSLGASPKGDRPFVDKYSLETAQKIRLFESDPERYQDTVGLLSPDGSKLLVRSESPTEPPNLYVRDAQGKLEPVTSYPDPTPQIRAIRKQLVTYQRPDGVSLSFTLYLPPNYQAGTRLPTVVWAYPLEYNDADTAGQISGSTKRFTVLPGMSHLFFLLDGYAILDSATMPVVGDPDTVNNTYIEQIVASAKAAIDKAVEMGVTDRDRVGVGGHSYGAFMTANLLAHSDLFRAGVARSGAYNRTLTPFGFQSERRTLWQASDTYLRISPFMFADKIKEPLLLIHGEADNNQGTFPIQSDRMYQAVRGNGGIVKLVFLPYESHGYAAQESIEHMQYEMISWFDKYVKQAGKQTTRHANSSTGGR